jgi:hypothetical protein
MQRQQHHHRPGGLPPPAVQIIPQLLDLTAWTLGEHADLAHANHDLAGRMDDLTGESSAVRSVCGSPAWQFAVCR